jgi:hypothetical protein
MGQSQILELGDGQNRSSSRISVLAGTETARTRCKNPFETRMQKSQARCTLQTGYGLENITSCEIEQVIQDKGRTSGTNVV